MSDTPASPQPTAAAPTAASAAPQSPAPATTPTASAVAQPTQITIDDFMKVQLKAEGPSGRTSRKSDKLLKLQVSLGAEQRQIVAASARNTNRKPWSAKPSSSWRTSNRQSSWASNHRGWSSRRATASVRGLATFAEDVEPGTKVK